MHNTKGKMDKFMLGILCLASLVAVAVTQTNTALFTLDGTFLGFTTVPGPTPAANPLAGVGNLIGYFISAAIVILAISFIPTINVTTVDDSGGGGMVTPPIGSSG